MGIDFTVQRSDFCSHFIIISKSRRPFVYTPTAVQNMRALSLAVCEGDPILIEGVAGAGKTALIHELAFKTGNTGIRSSLA